MNLVLTSNFPLTPIEAVFLLMRNIGNRPRVAWIPPYKDVGQKRFLVARDLFGTHGFSDLEYFATDKDLNDPHTQLQNYDIVYLSGGDPIRFRDSLIQNNQGARLRSYLANNGMVVATSGGSMQFTRNVSLFRLNSLTVTEVIAQRNEYDALGVVPYEFLPHLDKHDDGFLEKVRQYSQAITHPVIGVEDGGALLHKSRDEYQFVGRAAIFHHGNITLIGEDA